MNAEQEKQIEEQIEAELKKSYLNGLLDGSVAMCGSILQIAEGSNTTESERVSEIISLCKVSLGNRRIVGKDD